MVLVSGLNNFTLPVHVTKHPRTKNHMPLFVQNHLVQSDRNSMGCVSRVANLYVIFCLW